MSPSSSLRQISRRLQVQLAVLVALGRDRLALGRERIEARAEIGELALESRRRRFPSRRCVSETRGRSIRQAATRRFISFCCTREQLRERRRVDAHRRRRGVGVRGHREQRTVQRL